MRAIVWKQADGVKLRRGRSGRAWTRWFAWCWLVTVGLLVTGFGPPRLVDREIDPTARVSVGELRRWAEMREVSGLTAPVYLVHDAGSDRRLLGSGTTEVRAPASLTKLMTALLVIEEADLDALVTVTSADIVSGATMGLVPGIQVTVMDLLWGLLVPSGNDAALALARHMAGSADAFVERMNVRADELGLTATRFANPHGLDAAGHVSSAEDLLALTQLLWREPLFRTMVGTSRVTVNGRELRNTNAWLSSDAGVIGVKTGTTDLAGENLIAAVEREGRVLFVMVLGSRARYSDAARLVDAAVAAFVWQTLDANDLSVLNRLVDVDGMVRYVQATGAPPTLLQLGPGLPKVRVYRRFDASAMPGAVSVDGGDVTFANGMSWNGGEQVGLLEWWAGTEQIGIQTLVVR